MTEPEISTERVSTWERRAEWPLTIAALLFLAAYAWPILDPNLPKAAATACQTVALVAWAAFAIDYAVRVALSHDRWKFVRTHLFGLAVVVLPMFRPLRLLRLVTVLSALNRYAGSSLRGRVGIYAFSATTLALIVASLAILDAERGAPDANITTYGAALWWSFATVTTVGYGDQYPVTLVGRLIAASLMLTGIALLGVITASVATWMIEQIEEIEEESQSATVRDIRLLLQEVRGLRHELATRRDDEP